MNVLLTGANGFVGRNIAAVLAAAGHQVMPISRQYGVDFAQMPTVADWLPHLHEMDAVINAVGIIGESSRQRFDALHTHAPIALFQAAREAGINRVIQISALGADESAFSAYHLSKLAADNALRDLDLDWFVLRPSLIYGSGGTSAELLMRAANLPLIPVIGDGNQALQPVHISDVAATVSLCLIARTTRQTLDVVGTETIVYSEWLQLMRQARGLQRAPLFHVPLALAKMFVKIGHRFHPMLREENLRMLLAGYGANAEPLAQFLGRPPLQIEPKLFFSDATNTKFSS